MTSRDTSAASTCAEAPGLAGAISRFCAVVFLSQALLTPLCLSDRLEGEAGTDPAGRAGAPATGHALGEEEARLEDDVAVDAAGEAVDAAGEAVDAAGEAVDFLGKALVFKFFLTAGMPNLKLESTCFCKSALPRIPCMTWGYHVGKAQQRLKMATAILELTRNG